MNNKSQVKWNPCDSLLFARLSDRCEKHFEHFNQPKFPLYKIIKLKCKVEIDWEQDVQQLAKDDARVCCVLFFFLHAIMLMLLLFHEKSI